MRRDPHQQPEVSRGCSSQWWRDRQHNRCQCLRDLQCRIHRTRTERRPRGRRQRQQLWLRRTQRRRRGGLLSGPRLGGTLRFRFVWGLNEVAGLQSTMRGKNGERWSGANTGTCFSLKIRSTTQKETLCLRGEIWWRKSRHGLHHVQDQREIARVGRAKDEGFRFIFINSCLMYLTVAGSRITFSVDRACVFKRLYCSTTTQHDLELYWSSVAYLPTSHLNKNFQLQSLKSTYE